MPYNTDGNYGTPFKTATYHFLSENETKVRKLLEQDYLKYHTTEFDKMLDGERMDFYCISKNEREHTSSGASPHQPYLAIS